MKNLLIFTLFFGIVAIGASNAIAQSVTIPNPLGSGGSDIPTLIDTIATWLLGIGLTISTIIIIWAAFLFMTSGGSEKKVTQARQTLWYAIIGLVILLLAKGVTSIVRSFLSGNF
ncbi:MAG: TrbC/VirB2 family protein [Candidatus Azambacteria bacterium]|nr:TrbC/VirB2 family protein [Candidatus Azambacteria bacterium]